MRASYKRFSVITGFALLIVVLTVNGWVIRRQLRVQVENQVWVTHTQQVLLELQQVESLLTEAETGQRGYLYTGEADYLAPYNRALEQIEPHIQNLAELTADNPRQRGRIPQLRGLAQQKLSELAATVSLYRTGDSQGARRLVMTNRGLHTMSSFRALLATMRQEELGLETVRTQIYWRSVRVTVACIYLASILAGIGLILLAYFVLREMNLRERHAIEIKRREEWFRVTLTSIGDGVIATDEKGDVIFVNPVAERLTGRGIAGAKGLPISDVFPIYNELTLEPVDNPVRKVMALGHIVGLANHTVLKHANGTLIPIEDSAAPIRDDQGQLAGVVLVFRDATADRRSQELVRKSEKIAAAARLAATVAHEINNPLEAVGNLLYLAKLRDGVPPAAVADLTLAEDELARASHVTRQTLGFYRESTFADALDLPALVESVLKLYSNRLTNKNIVVKREFSPCPAFRGWAGELRQVISNLISNAIDAMSAGGTLQVGVAVLETPDGELIELRVEDDGRGIDPEHLDSLFEPFFTTKKEVGTGLGLYVSKQIVERHGGTIHAQSKNTHGAHGAVFRVVLPCTAGAHFQAAKSA